MKEVLPLCAIRPNEEKTVGMKSSKKIMHYPCNYFRSGANNEGNRMSGAMMTATLLQKYPRRYNFLMQQHINSMIQNLF